MMSISSIVLSQTERANWLLESRVDSLVGLMTLDEKLGQLTQLAGVWDKQVGKHVTEEQLALVRAGKVGSSLNVGGAEATKALKAFRRINLQPGEKKEVQFVLKPDQLAFYDIEMKRVIEPGTFTVYVGPNSAEALESDFEVVSD